MGRVREILLHRRTFERQDDTGGLKRVLGPVHLTMMGIGAIIGTGMFVLIGTATVGTAERPGAGPAIIISFFATAFACGLAALCYAEFAAMVPISGSAYTYAYASFGEIFAWIIGWDLLLEYAVGNVSVAIGWSSYLATLLAGLGLQIPPWLTIDPMSVHEILADPSKFTETQVTLAQAAMETAPKLGLSIFFNLPAFLIVFFVTVLLAIGIRESARVNNVLVALKLVIIALFLWYGLSYVDFAKNWQDFAPNGFKGIQTGAALIFFAYVGFDALSTTSEECRNPQRDVPIGMIASLVICSLLYVAVSTILTAMVPLEVLNNAEPLAAALNSVGETTIARIVSAGAIISITSVLLVLQLGQSRILYAMSCDGLLPRIFSQTSNRFGTPIWATIVTGIAVGIPAALMDITVAAELCNIGTLFAFAMVAIGVLILRYQRPDAARAFRVPFAVVICPACVVMCSALIFGLPVLTWLRFGVWMLVGLVIYYLTVLPFRLKQHQATSYGPAR